MSASVPAGPERWATHRLLGIVARLTERRLNRQLARLRLTKGGLEALEAVAELEPATASDVADLLCVSKQSLGKVLHRLRGLGYLAKEPAIDGRSANLRLTEAGRTALSTAEDLIAAIPESVADAEFRHQLEHHITQLRNMEHIPLPRRRAAQGHHRRSSGFAPQNIIDPYVKETGAPQ
jgi:DNA-binding MarR family transcriptional regulator